MKLRMKVAPQIFIMLLFLLFTSAGCNSVAEPKYASTMPVKSVVPATVSITESPAMPPAPSPTPVVTSTPSLPILSLTPSLIPTMTDTEVNDFLLSFTKHEPNCDLPCLGNIRPGVTHWDDINPFIISRGSEKNKPNAISEAYALFPGFPEDKLVLAWFLFSPENGVVDSLSVKFKESGNLEAFQSQFEIYSPEKIIREHGQPSRVLLSSVDYTLGTVNEVGWSLWLFYDQKGLMIRYDGASPFQPGKYHICPKIGASGTIGQVYFDLRSEQSRNFLGKSDDVLKSSGFSKVKSFQDATGKNLDDFSRIFTQSQQPACFDTPRDIWK